jgi:penicillin-binding protein 2
MLVFDQLRKDDPQLRFLAVVVLAGMLVLLSGLWWVQVASSRHYQKQLEIQSLRSVRIPAVRGRILDREGRALAENHPEYDIDLYPEALSRDYQIACSNNITRVKKYLSQQVALKKQQLGRDLTVPEKKQFALTRPMIDELNRETRYEVTSNIVADLATRLGEPLELTQQEFQEHYDKALAMPLPILMNLNATEIARFEEQSLHTPAMDLDVQSIRTYPNNSLAAHVLGYLRHTYTNEENDPRDKYNYRLADYAGASGIEKMFDSELRGTAGAKSVLVNNLGYRQGETIWSPSEAGEDVQLTIDLDIQKAAEAALKNAQANARGAVVVMNVHTGDILAMASAPNYDPNHFLKHPDPDWDEDRWMDPQLGVQKNRAMHENYRPGSTFKILIGLAALEQGVLDPHEQFDSLGYYPIPGKKPIGDTAGAGLFDFNRAMAKSSNPYFITQGIKPGVLPRVIMLGEHIHFGEKTGLIPGEETPGRLPTAKRISSHWYPGDTMYLSIGQGEIDVTPLQMAVFDAAIANGGTVLWPRLVIAVKTAEGANLETYPQGRVRDTLPVNPRNLEIVRRGMLEDVQSPEGSGREVAIPGFQIAGKTGTAEVERNDRTIDKSLKDTWFVSYGPYENPRYAVVAFVEGGLSGGKTCVPVVKAVYEALVAKEKQNTTRGTALAELPK